MKKTLLTALAGLTLFGGAHAALYNTPCAPDCNTYASSCGSFLNGVTVDADFLWWKTAQDNAYVLVDITDRSVTPNLLEQSIVYYDYQWKPGYRIALGYDTCVCGYNVELYARWTWFRTAAHINYDFVAVADQRISLGDSFYTVITVDTAGAEIAYRNSTSFLYERLDFGFISRCYQLGYFTVNPFAAVTGVFVKDSYKVVSASTTPEVSNDLRGSGKFSGGGITLGAEVNYPVMQSVFLYSISEATGLWGKVNSSSLLEFSDASGSLEVNTNKSIKFWGGRFIIAQELGVEYVTCLGSFPVNAHLGWQFMYLPSMAMNQAYTFEDRTVNGLVAGVAVGF
jgi:hypothetical protein